MAERGIRLHRSVALVGMMGSGKSAIGRTLAARLGLPLLDSDAALEEAARRSIAEIFARDGEAFFRDREHEVIARLLSGPPAILSTGGGAFLFERNRRVIGEKGVSVWLDADLPTLWERVRHKDTRPLLRAPDPRARLAALLEERRPFYALADLAVRSEAGFTLEQTTDRVMEALRARPGLLAEE
ncbi:shikimate kinase [Wenxinia saemankumensis]|uniref:Shikimate kinase n=1 Tax=Wenxinia saemankumensis TaxID=1447782 RepID=A0A1M5ZZX0_9RHOB|nr:shikimate kinase [Wenxinia saemankumensis]SHI29811.1 shikimate kinase [Wenxinia saemankumensis]